jgi:hypothetical protein
LTQSTQLGSINDIEILVNETLENDKISQALFYYKQAVYYKEESNLLLSKECFLKSFDILKGEGRNFNYKKIEILKDYCKLLVTLGEIQAAEINYFFLIKHCFMYYGAWSEHSINVLVDFVEFKLFISQHDSALSYIEYANTLLNQMKFFKKSTFKRDLDIKIKSYLYMLYYVNGHENKIKNVLNKLHALLKELSIYQVKDILSTFSGKESEEHMKEIEEYITYHILQSKYLQTIGQLKEAQAVLERMAIICKRNIKRFSKQSIEINIELIAIFKQNQSNDFKLLQLVDENVKQLKSLKQNKIENVITIMSFCEILISLNQLNKAYELINHAEKMLNTILGNYDETIYTARLDLLLGAYYLRKNDLEIAEKIYNKSMETFDKVLGNNNYSFMIKCELADLYEKKQKENTQKENKEEENYQSNVVRVDLNEEKKGSSLKKTNK